MPTIYLLLAVYACASTLTFSFYAFDKWAARTRRRRTPERTLLWMGFLCGWPGAWLAQSWLRHKSVKQPFRAWFLLTVVVNLACLLGMIYVGKPWE